MRVFVCLLLLCALPLVLAKGAVNINGAGSSFATAGTQPQVAAWKATTAWSDNYEGTFAFVKNSDFVAPLGAGSLQFAGDDSALSPAEIAQVTNANKLMLFHVPQYLSAHVLVYNFPGFSGPAVNLTAALIAKLYSAATVKLNDADLLAINPALAASGLDLTQTITVCARNDPATASYELTQFLAGSKSATGASLWPAGFNYLVNWTAINPSIKTGDKGSTVLNFVKTSTGPAIAYSKRASADELNIPSILKYASIQNRFGRFVAPEPANVQLTASSAVAAAALPLAAANTWDSVNLGAIATDVNSYPIVNPGYLVVPQLNQISPSTSQASNITALTTFLTAATVSTGLDSVLPAGYVPITQNIRDFNKATINNWLTPGGPGTPGLNAAPSTAAASLMMVAVFAVIVNRFNQWMM